MGLAGGAPKQDETNTCSKMSAFTNIRLLHIPDSVLSCLPNSHPSLHISKVWLPFSCKCIWNEESS